MVLLTAPAATVLPATSVKAGLRRSLVPSLVVVSEPVVLPSMPDSASLAEKVAWTRLVYQPLAPSVPFSVTDLSTTGAVWSSFTVAVAAALVLPALSVQVPGTSMPVFAVSAVTVTGLVQEAMPLAPTSPALVKVTTTLLLLFQPAAFGAGAIV